MDVHDAVLKLGAKGLRGKQGDAIDAINSGSDVVYLFPTGTGKTLVYEASALCSKHVTVVVSPLVGLLQQQSNRLANCGVGVLQAWDGKVSEKGTEPIKVAYTTPEQLVPGTALREHLRKYTVGTLVVDEAHLVVQWDSFRCDLVFVLQVPVR
jgi:ATP-dependent DNA helicase RecQ